MWGIRMDDLDHSIHIAEYDWASFYEESEECGLLQPSLARPDDSSLSDSEDSGNLSSVPQETQQSPDVKSAAAAGGSAATKLPAQLNLSGATGQEDDTATKAEEGFEIHLDFPGGNTVNTEVAHIKTAENITEETSESEELTKDGDVRPERDLKPSEEPDPLSSQQTRLNVNEPHTAERAVMEDLSKAFRAEKERWFVTVNDSPAQQRLSAASVKKKQRQKKVSEGNHMCSSGQENSLKDKNEFEMNEDRDESWGGGDTQPNQNLNKNSGENSCDETKAEVRVASDSPQMSNDEEDLSEKLVISHSANENITETMMDRDKFEPGGTASTSRGTFKQVESVESDELEDSVEFLSIHSYDSESYLSAAESVDEAQHPLPEHLIENQQLLFSLFERHLFSLTEDTDADWTQDGQMHSCDLSSDVSAADCEGYESTGAESSLTFPSAGRRATAVPDDNSTCDNNTHSTMLCVPPDTPEPQTREMNLSAPGCSQVDRPGPLLVPDLTITPCPAADSPETYAQAAGHTRPVYAISAFWDEMEKLTINDILQLRTGRSTPLRHNTQDTVTSNADDSPTNPGSLVDTAEYGSSDSTLMDTSDTADSDYFTQTDESKPDRSSCEFSTSDFEEEYWQFLGTSRNPSPDPQSKHQQRRRDSSFLSHEEESTGSEGKETPVPLEDFAGRCSDDHEPQTLTSGELALPRPITKSRSMQNIHDLNTEGLSLLGNSEGGLSLSRCSPLEDNVVVTMSDTLGSLLPASLSNSDFLDAHYQISFPEVFEYFFTEDIENIKSQCVAVYDPQDISVAPVFDYALCTFSDETSSSSVQCSEEEKPIPIFSCCPPTVRDLTFPKPDYVFLSSNCEEVEDISPIRVVAHSFIQADHHSGSRSWKSLLSIRKIRFHDKGSIWCRRSGAWMFPVEFEKRPIKTEDPVVAVLSEGRVCPAASQLFRELEEQQRILETIRTTRREGVFSTLKQSDMCLVCIAFASWVLRSSDPEAADAWKAALLANVSALSAIQYLRQYVKKKNPPPDEP